MTYRMPIQLPPPRNWQDFESLCCDLWSKIWGISDAMKNGRVGQKQCGIDIHGQVELGVFDGVQCKGKDNYSTNILTIDELNSEIDKALAFKPKLRNFIVATTSKKDVHIEQWAREVSAKHKEECLFSVVVYAWPDIVDKLMVHKDVLDNYYTKYGELLSTDAKLFSLWSKMVKHEDLNFFAGRLPFSSHDVLFSEEFLMTLESWLNRYELGPLSHDSVAVNHELNQAFQAFNLVIRDLIYYCKEYEAENTVDCTSSFYIYQVKKPNSLDYSEFGKFIEFKKTVVKGLFLYLIKSANHLIDLQRRLKIYTREPVDFISVDFGFDLELNNSSTPTEYPVFSKDELERDVKYHDIGDLESYIRNELKFEKELIEQFIIELKNSYGR